MPSDRISGIGLRICRQRDDRSSSLMRSTRPSSLRGFTRPNRSIANRDASKFLNAVVEFDYDGDPGQLLEQLARIEESLGRKRDHQKNVSRTLDIDLLYCGDRQIDNERLQLPHPRMHLRKFVLQPLTDIRPDLILPNQRKTVRQLLAASDESGDVVRLMNTW